MFFWATNIILIAMIIIFGKAKVMTSFICHCKLCQEMVFECLSKTIVWYANVFIHNEHYLRLLFHLGACFQNKMLRRGSVRAFRFVFTVMNFSFSSTWVTAYLFWLAGLKLALFRIRIVNSGFKRGCFTPERQSLVYTRHKSALKQARV